MLWKQVLCEQKKVWLGIFLTSLHHHQYMRVYCFLMLFPLKHKWINSFLLTSLILHSQQTFHSFYSCSKALAFLQPILPHLLLHTLKRPFTASPQQALICLLVFWPSSDLLCGSWTLLFSCLTPCAVCPRYQLRDSTTSMGSHVKILDKRDMYFPSSWVPQITII